MKKWMLVLAGVVVVVMGLTVGCEKQKQPAVPPRAEPAAFKGTIVAFGDSLTAGLGLPEEEAYPAQLEKKLRQEGHPWRVVNAGISGETSSGALSRVAWLLKLKPDIVILETGGNDGLRGVDPALTRANIDEIVRILKENKVSVVLAGMRMVTNLGRLRTDAFAAIYPAVARKHDLVLIHFFLEGVAGDAALNQSDGIHPTAEGYRIVVAGLYPFLLRVIEHKK